MSRARRQALATLQISSGLDVELIDRDSLERWVSTDRPLHPAYEFLSSTHRSDYLRSYFMYHFGGGYADIKPFRWNWRPFFDELERDSDDVDFFGSPEQSKESVAGGTEVQVHWRSLVSNCAFVFKPQTKFAAEWRQRVHQALDGHLAALRLHPGTYHPRAVASGIHSYGWLDLRRGPRGYPLRWAEIQGEIFHKLQIERLGAFRAALPPLDFGRYR